jgi:hypothetical protein
MSSRHISGVVVISLECDGDDCEAKLSGIGSWSKADLRKQARAAGWTLADDSYPWHQFASDLCPACTERARDQAMQNPPQDEGDNP